MQGTLPQKVGRLVAHLAAHPGYWPRYLHDSVLNGNSPLDLQLPWFSYAAIDFLENFLRPHMTAFEYGTGGSTLFLARRVRSVCSIEDNPVWFERVSARLKLAGLSNVTLRLCPFDFKNPVGFERADYLHAIPPEPLDVIVVDGSEEWTPVRPLCFRLAESRVRSGGIIVLDDSWRYPGLRTDHRAKRVQVFQSVGPCRPGVTSTDIFFY